MELSVFLAGHRGGIVARGADLLGQRPGSPAHDVDGNPEGVAVADLEPGKDP